MYIWHFVLTCYQAAWFSNLVHIFRNAWVKVFSKTEAEHLYVDREIIRQACNNIVPVGPGSRVLILSPNSEINRSTLTIRGNTFWNVNPIISSCLHSSKLTLWSIQIVISPDWSSWSRIRANFQRLYRILKFKQWNVTNFKLEFATNFYWHRMLELASIVVWHTVLAKEDVIIFNVLAHCTLRKLASESVARELGAASVCAYLVCTDLLIPADCVSSSITHRTAHTFKTAESKFGTVLYPCIFGEVNI